MIVQGRVPQKHLKAIDYFATKLFTPQLSRHICITVQYKKSKDYWGLTIIDDYNKKGLPRFFIIEVNKEISEEEKIKTIAHEMVHVKQYAKLELNEQMSYWRGRKMKKDIPYVNQPWEIEAFKIGDKLYGEYNANS